MVEEVLSKYIQQCQNSPLEVTLYHYVHKYYLSDVLYFLSKVKVLVLQENGPFDSNIIIIHHIIRLILVHQCIGSILRCSW